MDQFEKDEFWKSLGRLYDSTLKLVTATEKLAETARAHEELSRRHEGRLDKIEVVQQWLAEKERKREKDEQGE